uniref:Uncharacterized protein n=1 Tax=Anguilla anguilla TaxID=7936 RepID=A0A0E9VL04_ANGAN
MWNISQPLDLRRAHLSECLDAGTGHF